MQLPGGRIVELRGKPTQRPRATKDDVFGGARELLKALAIEPGELSLAEFHGLRALTTHWGWLSEESVDITCRNCQEPIAVKPCEKLRTGPFVDAELDDPELDTLLDLEKTYEGVRLHPLTARDAFPLHKALAKRRFRVTPEVVSAMGIATIDDERDPVAIAELLAKDEDLLQKVCGLFHDAHYAPRLFALVLCPKCGARNDVDAPYDREFERELWAGAPEEGFPSLDEFDAMAQRIALPDDVRLVIDGNVPACDDGGEPLLGSFLPTSTGGEVALYYRTFESMWNEDGPYDVEAELRETIEHELEHHAASLAGHDAMDDDERDEIAHEAMRVIGRREIARSGAAELFRDLGEFARRTWLVWLVALIAVAAAILSSR